MSTLLKIILVILFGCKLIADSGAIAFKDVLVKVALEDDESKTEKEKEQEKFKFSGEDKWYICLNESSASNSFSSFTLPAGMYQNFYISYINKPQTPPPDKFSLLAIL